MELLIYGLQRSGTNYIEQLLKNNYRVIFLNMYEDRKSIYHKHFRLYDQKELIPEPKYLNNLYFRDFCEFESKLKNKPDFYLVISKDPYSWLISYKKWAKKCKWPVPDYNYIEEYNLFYERWMDFFYQTNKISFVRYIDLLKKPGKTLDILERKFNLKKDYLLLKNVNFKRIPQSSTFSKQRKEYYLSKKYLLDYTDEEIDDINASLNVDLINFLGYELI